MAIANPVFVSLVAGQDGTVTVKLSESENVAQWTVTATVRAREGATALITKTLGSGVTNTDQGNGVWVISFAAADTSSLTPGLYLFEFIRSNAGFVYPICDPSAFLIRPDAANSLTPSMTNLSEYVAFRRESQTITDTDSFQYLLSLGAAEAAIRKHTGRNLTYGTYTEYRNGNGMTWFDVREPPITSITSLYLDLDGYYGQGVNAFAAADLLTSGTDYYFEIDNPDGLGHKGRVYRIGTVWPRRYMRPAEALGYMIQQQPGCIKITYIGGYALPPQDLKLAVWMTATLMIESAEQGRLFGSSESFEDYSSSLVSLADDAMRVGSVANILGNYRHGRTFVG